MTDTREGFPTVEQELSGVLVTREVDDITTDVEEFDFDAPLLYASVAYIAPDAGDPPSATHLQLCFAAADGQAASILAESTSRLIVMLGERRTWHFSPSAPCPRISLKANAAETGTSLVSIEGKAQV